MHDWKQLQWLMERQRSVQKGQRWRKTVRLYVPPKVFLLLPLILPGQQTSKVGYFPSICHRLHCAPITLPSRNIGRRSHAASVVNILVLRTWTTHYTHSFPLNGKRGRTGGGGLRGEDKCCHWLQPNPISLSPPSVFMCMFPFQTLIHCLVLFQEVSI